MKKIVLILTIISFLLLQQCVQKKKKDIVSKKLASLTLDKDSGYITKREGLEFLVAQSLSDTIDSYWKQVTLLDTIGKYYMISPNKFILYISDFGKEYSGASHFLIEIYSGNNEQKIIKKERIAHGNYLCFHTKSYEALQKTGNFFYVIISSTGSGFCGEYIYVFKHVMAQNSMLLIPISSSSFFGQNHTFLSSSFRLKDNVLMLNYHHEKGIYDPKTNKSVMNKKDTFSIKYFYEKDSWIIADSIMYKEKSDELDGL